MSDELTHLDEDGNVHMVDVGSKVDSNRRAVAEAEVAMETETASLLFSDGLAKGDALATTRLAGIMGAKRTPDLVPLCHPLMLTSVTVLIEPSENGARIEVTASTAGKTGVEMEAMTGASVAALTLYDMIKGIDRAAHISRVALLSKDGGKSGSWLR